MPRRTITNKDREIIAKGKCPICEHPRNLMRLNLDEFYDIPITCEKCGGSFKGTDAKEIQFLV